MKIYISGPISGVQEGNEAAFYLAQTLLEGDGYKVVNPHKIHDGETDLSWEGFMRRDLAEMLWCDSVLMLEGWRLSRGAKVEHNLAKKLGMPVVYIGGFFAGWKFPKRAAS